MSQGWTIAAIYICPGELSASERAWLVGAAEKTPKGTRQSMATVDDLALVTGVTSKSGKDRITRSLIKRGLIRQTERARYHHEARYALTFDAWVYDEAARRWVPPEMRPRGRTHVVEDGSTAEDPSHPETDGDTGDGSMTVDVTGELRPRQSADGSTQMDPSPRTLKDSSLPAGAVARLRAAGVTDDEQREIQQWVKEKNKVRGDVEGYLKPFTDEQIAEIVKTWRAERATAIPKVKRPPWCEDRDCDRDSRMRDLPDGTVTPCKACHPDPEGALRRAKGGSPHT